jgi:glycosyltransferase involved in cell wall biosynthesis
MANTGLVSIVLCTYNGISFIDDQLISILNQTYKDIEVIIVDDCSSDGTFEKLKSYAAKNGQIRLYRNEKNLGYNNNFSKACTYSTGVYIAIADQDDIWEADKIDSMVSTVRHEDIVLAHCISARFEKMNAPHIKSTKLISLFEGNDIKQLFIRNPIPGHNMLFKKSLLDRALPLPTDFFYDWWFAAIACTTGKIAAVNKILVWHRVHATNATGALKPKCYLYEEVQKILPVLLRLKGISTEDRNFGEQLMKYYKQFPAKKFSWPLFFFLLRHGKILFAYKKRRFTWFSYLKQAWKFSKAGTLV